MTRCRPTAAFCAMLALAAACADRNPTASPPGAAPVPAQALSVLRCSVDVRAGSLACRPAQPDLAQGARGVILGGQGLNVRLASSGTAYDAGTGILRTEVTVENLTTQMLGTSDGHLPAPEGVRVFLASGPDVSSGSGTVAVANADGTGVFTAAGQSFFRYPGILAPGDTTAPKEWRFALPPEVTGFTFTVYVATPVSQEGGWVSVTPIAPTLAVGGSLRLSAVVHGATGRPVPGARVTWSASNNFDSLATIDSTGLLKVYTRGFVDVTASSGGRTASVLVYVYDPRESSGLPMVWDVVVGPARVESNGVDSVTVRVAASDPGGIRSVDVALVSPNQQVRRSCDTVTRVSGTQTNGVFHCRFGFPPGTMGGVWRVTEVTVTGAQNSRYVSEFAYDFQSAGVQTGVYVRGPLSDYVPPVLTAFSISPDSVRTVKDIVTVDVAAMDADTGIASVTTTFTNGIGQILSCPGSRVGGTIHDGVWRCRFALPGFLTSTQLEVMEVAVRDRNGNVGLVSGSELEHRGFPRFLKVQPDTAPPVVTALAFAPDTVAGNGVDSMTVTIAGSDAWSGVRQLEAVFQRVGAQPGLGQRNCIAGFAAVPSRTVKCALRFSASETGSYHLLFVRALDNASNAQSLDAAQAAAAGFSTTFTVTP